MAQRDRAAVDIGLFDIETRFRITASACAANASFNSIRSMSASVRRPSSGPWNRHTGPIPMISGGTPPAAKLTIAPSPQTELTRFMIGHD